MKVASSFDRFATHDGAPIKVLVEALEQLEPYEKEVGYPLFESKDKDNGFEGKYSCKCKQSIHFGFC
jgi:hypothetical protein